MDAKGRFFYKGHPPVNRWKPFPCDIGLETYYRRHPVSDNQRSGRHWLRFNLLITLPFIVGIPYVAKHFNKRARELHGVNAYFWGYTPPYEYNATENPLPIWDNPLYDDWLKKQEKIREWQGDKALPRYVTVKAQ